MEQSLERKIRPFAVITGASSRIGLELAKQFAQNGFDLLVASNSESILEAQDTLEEFGTDVECMEVDLSTYNGVELLTKAIRSHDRPVDVLALNPGTGIDGDFDKTNLREEIKLINFNVISAIHLVKKIIPGMYLNGHGKILLNSSIFAEIPASNEAVYGASKAFINSFAEALRNEAKPHGVSVTILSSEEKLVPDLPEVAYLAYEATMAGAESIFTSTLKNKIQGWALRVLPERIKTSVRRKMSQHFLEKEPMSAHRH